MTVDDPLAWIDAFQQRYRVPDLSDAGLPPFAGGLVGYFGYDTVGFIEPRLANPGKSDTLETPDILLMLSDRLVVFDNLLGKLYLIVHVEPQVDAWQAGQHELDMLEVRLRTSATYPMVRVPREVAEQDFVSG